ncbi:uncharacterized protein LOC126678226 [Mercurialis annua]|uniref:uncharacterized protein LOC126678226 n=1 Tax=Mercurialis annua TaxID=3986 RepID=UPI002160C884|nr:uncharacterized protein LOC126678226 [Mercurialis annua]
MGSVVMKETTTERCYIDERNKLQNRSNNNVTTQRIDVPLEHNKARYGSEVIRRQKSYADSKRKEIEFQVGDYVFLKVSPMKGVIRFGKRGKLSPRYVGPYEIIERIGAVAYKLDLPPDMSQVHPVFHISMLRKYIADPSHVIQPQTVEVNEELSYEEQPVEIVDTQLRKLRTKEIPMVKVMWRNHSVEECTWETEADMRRRYPYLFLQGT